jgi:ribosomal protein S18 acetylase RimI-like enzyme
LTAVRDAAGSRRLLDGFLDLSQRVYAGDPWYVPSPRREVLAALRRPEFAGSQKALVALSGDFVVARLVARLSPELRDGQGRPYGMIGFFEALAWYDEPVGELFREAVSWLRQAGAGVIVGPMDGDTWHRYRLNVGPFDEPPFLLEPYNRPYYEALWAANDFVPLERYFSKRVDPAAVVSHLEGRSHEALAAGYRLRPLDRRRFRQELRIIYELSRRIFARNFLYTEIPAEEFYSLYAGARALLDPDLVWFAQAPSGEDVGFLFAYPDRFRAVAAMRGKRGLLAKLRFLRHRDEVDTVDFKTLGVLPEHRRSGVAAALCHEGHRQAMEKGYPFAHHCLFREGNPSGELDGGAGRAMRTYVLYQWKG